MLDAARTPVSWLCPMMKAEYHWVVPSTRYTLSLSPSSTLGVVSRMRWAATSSHQDLTSLSDLVHTARPGV